MHVIALLKTKGGVGASTICLHLAVAAVEGGKRVVIADMDPQGSLTAWQHARTAKNRPDVTVYRVAAQQLAGFVQAARQDGVDLCLIDTPPQNSGVTAEAVSVADMAIIPTKASPLDLPAVQPAAAAAAVAGTPGLFVLNDCPPSGPEVSEARAYLATTYPELRVWNKQLGHRKDYQRAVTAGAGVTEMRRSGEAAHEIRALLTAVKRIRR